MPFPSCSLCLHASPHRARRLFGLLLGLAMGAGGASVQAHGVVGDTATGEGATDPSGLVRLDDERLAAIRGRYVDARRFTDQDGNFVILWDERPPGSAGGKGQGNGKTLSSGEITSVVNARNGVLEAQQRLTGIQAILLCDERAAGIRSSVHRPVDHLHRALGTRPGTDAHTTGSASRAPSALGGSAVGHVRASTSGIADTLGLALAPLTGGR